VAQEGDVPPGGGGQSISNFNAPFTNAVGNVGFTGSLMDDLGVTENFVWFGDDVTWRNSDAPEVLSGAEGTMGISDTGGFIYSPSTDGDDSVYTHNGLLAVENTAAPDFAPPAVTTFHSRPTMTADGTAYWIAGINPDGDDISIGRVLYSSPGALPGMITKVQGFGDIVDGLEIEAGSGVDFDYNVSDNGHVIHVLLLETGDNNTDGHVVVDGSAVAQELSPNGGGDNWDNFDGVSINNSGNYLFSGDTDGDTGTDEFIAYNAGIVVREGDTLDGITLTSSATVQAISINNLDQSAFTWSYSGTETLFGACDASDPASSAAALLTTGDELDFDGDGIGDTTVVDLNASGAVGPGLSLGESGVVYVEVDVDDGTGEIEAIVGIALPCGGVTLATSGTCPGDVTVDVSGATPSDQIALLRGSGPGADMIPAGPCAGTVSGLADVGLVSILSSDASGNLSLTATLPSAVCGTTIQALDVATCELSGVTNVP